MNNYSFNRAVFRTFTAWAQEINFYVLHSKRDGTYQYRL